jgi:hypothetical protein
MLLNWRHTPSATDAAPNSVSLRTRKMINLGTTQKRTIQTIQRYVVVAAMAAIPVACHGQNLCPWLNIATASGVLGGPATVTVDKTDDHTETCLFRSQTGASADLLRISVTTVADPQNVDQELVAHEKRCASSTVPLKAVGNEAVLCTAATAQFRGAQVIGRVRNNIFTIEIRTHSKRSQATRNLLDEKVKEVANQVAGALF